MSEIPGLGTYRPFPSMARFRAVSGAYYVVCDPAAVRPGEELGAGGRIDGEWVSRATFVKSFLGGLLLAAVVAALDPGVPAVLLGFVLGTVLTSILVALSVRAKVEAARRRTRGRVLRIDESSSRAWAICRTVERITLTRAWSSGLVDGERVVPGVAWRSSAAALRLSAAEADVARAATHEDLQELAAARRRELDREAASLDEVERRLADVLRAAEQLDERRRELEGRARRSREESELRRRLTGSALPASSGADDAAEIMGVHARAEALDELLAESDRIAAGLRGHP